MTIKEEKELLDYYKKEANDFLPVKDTFPKHPLSNIKPKFFILSEMLESRKNQMKKEINDKMKKWDDDPIKFINEE